MPVAHVSELVPPSLKLLPQLFVILKWPHTYGVFMKHPEVEVERFARVLHSDRHDDDDDRTTNLRIVAQTTTHRQDRSHALLVKIYLALA